MNRENARRKAPNTLKRSDAARLLTEILIAAARDESKLSTRILTLCSCAGLTLPRKCEGEAHSNPHIDNCHQCAPHWEWIAPEIRIP